MIRDPHELLRQLRVPQESHLRKLLTAAHTYSLNWSRITSTFCRATRACIADGARGLAQPSRGTSRVTVGRGRDGRFTSHDWDAGLSLSLYYPPPGSSSRKRLSGNTGPWKGELPKVTRTPTDQTTGVGCIHITTKPNKGSTLPKFFRTGMGRAETTFCPIAGAAPNAYDFVG